MKAIRRVVVGWSIFKKGAEKISVAKIDLPITDNFFVPNFATEKFFLLATALGRMALKIEMPILGSAFSGGWGRSHQLKTWVPLAEPLLVHPNQPF